MSLTSGRELSSAPQGSSAEVRDISLIICTRNRCQQLARCLEYVRGISFEQRWELIIVDNGSVDETAAVIREFIGSASVPVIYLFEPKPGKSNALNAATAVAQGQILAFTDDDCYPAVDFLSEVWSRFDDPSVGYITGRIILHDPTDCRVAINESTIPRTFPGRSLLYSGDVGGGNMAFRRKVLLDIGGFDPLFGPGSLIPAAEDVDVAGRASAIGWKGRYCPEVIVRHHHGRKVSDLAPLLRSYDIGRGAYNMKLILRGHGFIWFARMLYGLLHPSRWGTVFWEAVGAAKYLTHISAVGLRSINRRTG